MTLGERLSFALPSLGLPEERCGANRGSHLSDPSRVLYRWLLRCFASGESPALEDGAVTAEACGVEDFEAALQRMVDEDLIQRNATGEITSAYPFSAIPTTHIVTLDDGTRLYAMCAVDALGIPSMLGTGAVIATTDPITGTAISIHVDASGRGRPDPVRAMVLCAAADGRGPLASLCCPLVNTFESEASAESFLGRHPELHGPILSIHDAIACGATVFGGALG